LETFDNRVLPTTGLGRSLANRYLAVLAAVAALVVVDQSVIQPLMIRVSWYAPIINAAGRQRMLSQKLTKAALALERTDDREERRIRREELRDTLSQWSNGYAELRDGGPRLGLVRNESAEIEREWKRLSPHFDTMRAAADAIVFDESGTKNERLAEATKIIVENEADFLTSMERIVELLEHEAANALYRLRLFAAAIAAGIISLLLALGWFVIRPATSAIGRQVEDLETRVAVRTQELSAALGALHREIAEREQSEIKTQRLSAQLAHAGRVWTMGHLTTGLAHELNQPLATIANYAEAFDVELSRAANVRTERLRTIADQTKQAALRAGEIVRRMRNFVRPSAPSSVEVDVAMLIHEVVGLCRTEADHAETEIVVDLPDGPAIVSVDHIQIQQVLVNLIQNAIQAMSGCSRDVRRVRIGTTARFEDVLVTVADSGPGFVATDAESCFEPFVTTKRGGLGIGLSICRAIIEQHGGSIWADTSISGGATIAFTLPRSENNAATRSTQYECVCR
jgi:C4-dicarboxylate-specific signal transduction histidine kinase